MYDYPNFLETSEMVVSGKGGPLSIGYTEEAVSVGLFKGCELTCGVGGDL